MSNIYIYIYRGRSPGEDDTHTYKLLDVTNLFELVMPFMTSKTSSPQKSRF